MPKFEKGNKAASKVALSATIGRYIREKVGDDFKKLVDELYIIATSTKYSAQNRMKAAEILMDRALGKPHQAISETVTGTNTVVITNFPPRPATLSDWEKQVEEARSLRTPKEG